ncbi:MAG: PhnD/SsuA/transferrin family substrate-binding protein [Deltaproteobacteria bacterium]|nr:PhnD/SsuA/transferrin family substrate-binding protein [Deltaproteobacteria bacterium]
MLLTAVLLLCCPRPVGSASFSSFYYFNPDSTQSNLTRLKETMDAALTSGGLTCAFQPFVRLRDFEAKIVDDPPDFLFLPEWYLRQDGNLKKRFKPFLVPVRQGTSTYRKVLLVAADSDLTMEKLPGVTIAMTPMGQAGLAMLNEAIFAAHGLTYDKLTFVTTAKDSDALFALALRQVKAALVSMDNLTYIGRINPQIPKTVKTLAVSQPVPLPVLCYAQGIVSAEEVEKLKSLLLAGRQNENVAKIMEMLQIDAWQVYPH